MLDQKWAIGVALLDECGLPGENDDRLQATVKHLFPSVKKYSLIYLRQIRRVAFNFKPETRLDFISWTTYDEALYPEVLNAVIESLVTIEAVRKWKRQYFPPKGILPRENREKIQAVIAGIRQHELARKAARWVADHEEALRDADPDMPEALHDRACDNWRGPLAIADLAGGDWPQKARSAAQNLSTQGIEQADQSRGVMLLADIRPVFAERQKKGGKDSDRISSADLVGALGGLTDRPWLTWSRGRPITTVAVARLLKTFGIVPNTIKLADGKQPNGYKRSQFDDAFGRYLSHSPNSPVQSSPCSPTPAKPGICGQFQSSPQGVSGELPKPAQSFEKYGVGEHGELSTPPIGSSDQSGDPGVLIGNDFDWLMQET